MSDLANPTAYAVELRGLTKKFREVVANSGVDLKIRSGSVHAIIGENGAGKSTAMKMLYGLIRPDEGEILVHGKSRHWKSPREAIACGIGMVHQHFMLAGPYTALENVVLGAESAHPNWRWLPPALRPVDYAGARKKLEALSKKFGFHVDWDAPIETLSVGIQQRIEILKLLYREASVLIFDEPTAVLTPQEVTELFVNFRKLRGEGKTIIVITHKLKEVMSIADRVSVFRAGKNCGEKEIGETSVEELASLMVGRKVSLSAAPPAGFNPGAECLEVKELSLKAPASFSNQKAILQNLSFSIRSGEILGIAGVEGNGQSELLHSLMSPQEYGSRLSGEIRYFNHEVFSSTGRKGAKPTWSTDRIRNLRVSMIPEDRHHEGLLLERSVLENFLLGLHRKAPFYRWGMIAYSKLRARLLQVLEDNDVRPRSTEILVGRMSGGNQQKLIIAREFENDPKFLIAAQPTRGVDVGAIEMIHQKILLARGKGLGVLLVSSELDEILDLSDRILVMYGGRIVASYQRGECTERDLGLKMGGAS